MKLIAIRLDHNWSDSQKSFANVRWSHYDGTSNNFFLNDTTGSILTRIPKGFGVDARLDHEPYQRAGPPVRSQPV